MGSITQKNTMIIYEKFTDNSWKFMFFLNTNCHELSVNFRKNIDFVLMELIGLMKRIRLNRKKQNVM